MAKTVKYDATKMGPLSWRQLQLANQEAYANLDIDDDLRSALQQVTNNMSIPNSGSPEINWEGRVQSPIMRNSNGRDYWGKSMWDEQVADANDFENNLSDLRGQNQPWYAQLGAGLLKGVTTFATTWLDGTIGLLYGVGSAIRNGDEKTGWDRTAQIFHNDVSNALQDFNEYMEEVAPNYKSRDEENNKWYQNLGTMNFLADGLIKNLGFTVGAFYSGGLFTKGLRLAGGAFNAIKAGRAARAYKAAKIEELVKAGMSAEEAAKAVNPMATAIKYNNTLKALEGAQSGTGAAVAGSLFSAVNEGRIEANQVYRDAFTNTGDWRTSKGAAQEILMNEERVMREIAANPNLTEDEKAVLQQQTRDKADALLKQAEQNAAQAGMLTLGLNIPILTLDNFKMFGRLYSRGFKQSAKQVSSNVITKEMKAAQEAVKNATTKQEKKAAQQALREAERKAKAAHYARNRATVDDVAENVAENEGKLAWNEITTGQKLWRGTKMGLMEGNEEMMQAFVSSTAGAMTMPEDPDAYYKALTDPNATVKTNDFLTSLTKGFLDSYGNGDRWEEGAIGFLTGILGMPTFGARANSDSNTYLGRGKMIGLSGGLFGEFSNANYLNRLGAESVKNINAFRDRYKQHAQFLAQSQAFTDAMDGYLQDKSEFAYNNARDNDDFAMIQALAVTGRLDEAKSMINFDVDKLTDEDLRSIATDFTANRGAFFTPEGKPITTDESGKPLQGAWRDANGNPMSETKEGKAEMKRLLKEKQETLNTEIDDYVASLDSVRAQVNNSLDESQVRELAWLDWKGKQWSRRFQDVQEDQNEAFKTISSAITQALDARDKDGNPVYTDKDTINKLKELQELVDKILSAKSPMELYKLSALDGNLLNKLYAKVKGEKFAYDVFDIIKTYIANEGSLNTIFESLFDIKQMALAQHQFSEKLNEYTSDPAKLAANRQKIEEERKQTQDITDSINTRKKLGDMTVKDYMDMSDEDKEKIKAQAKEYDDESINTTISYGDEIDSITQKMMSNSYEDENTDTAMKGLVAEAITAMKGKATKPEEISVQSAAYLEWKRAKRNEFKSKGYEEGLNILEGLDAYIMSLREAEPEEDVEDYDDEDDTDYDDSEPQDFDDVDDDSTGHDATTSVPSVREKQKKDTKKQEKKKKKEEELSYTDQLWQRLIDIAPEGEEDRVETLAKPIRADLERVINNEKKKGAKQISTKAVILFKGGMFPSDSYKELEKVIEDKSLLENTIIGIINDYIKYINSTLAKEVADNKAVIEGDKKKVEEPEEEVRTPVIPESEIDTYAESQHKNRSSVGRDIQKNYWLPRTTQYGIGSTEFSKPEFDENGRQLKYWERVKKDEGNYSPKLRAKIVTVGQWLDEHGVFDNVDGALDKTLKQGTEISFTTNQELNDLVADAMWKADNKQGEKPKPVIILMAVGDDLHIVGDMAEPDLKNLGTQEKHLAAFVNDFNKRYGEWLGDSNQDHSKPFVHPMKTKVHQGLIGRMIYNEKKDRNTLNSIFGDSIILGVALEDKDSGKLDIITNPNKSKKDAKTNMENNILPPRDPKAGQPYVVIPSLVSEKYICVPFTIPSLSEVRKIDGYENFGLIRNLNDTLVSLASIDFTKDNVDEALIAAKDELESILNVTLWIEYKDGKLIIKRKTDKKYVQVYAEPVSNIGKDFVESIITEFANAGIGFQIDRKKINKSDYNRLIGEIANTNLPVRTDYHTKNDWFTVEPINVESGKRSRITSNIKTTGVNPNASDKAITVTRTANGKTVKVYVDLNNDTVSYTDSKGKLQVIQKSDFGNKENAHKAWAYAIGQSRGLFTNTPNKNTLPYQTKNNDEYFDPVNYRFLASKEEFDDLCKLRSSLPNAINTLEVELKKSVGKDITVNVEDKSKSGYPIVEIQRTDGENGVYTNKFRVSEEGNIESAAGWASDNPTNWEVDNSVTNRGGDTISFTPVLDFYKTLGFTPKPTHTTTTQTTTEQQPTVETKQSAHDFEQEGAPLEKQIEGFTREEKATVKADIIRRLNKSLNGSGHMYNPNNPQVLTAEDVTIILDKETRAKLVMAVRESKKAADAFARAIIEDAISEVEAGIFSNVADYAHGRQLDTILRHRAKATQASEQQPTTPQVSEQAPSTEITKEEREEITKNNQVQLPSSKYPSGNNNIGGYLAQISSNDGGSWGRVADTYDGSSSYYRMFDINGDTAKFEFYAPGREHIGISKWSSILDSVANYEGNTDTADTIFTVEAGEVKRNSNGRWVVTKRIQLQLVKKEDIVDNVYTDTEAVKRDIYILQIDKNRKRQAWENQKREQEQEQINEDFDDSFDVEEASPEVEQAIGEVIQGTNLGLSIDEVFKQNSNLEQLYNSNPQFKDSVDSLRKVMEENKQKEEEQKAREQQIAEEPAKTPDDIVKEYLEKAKDPEYRRIWDALSNEGKKKLATNYAKDSKTFNSKMREIKKFWNKKEGKFTLGGEPKFRVETKQDTTKWNREEEMAWLKKALPQLSNEQRVQIVDGLIRIKNSDNPGYAWGQFYRGLITISNEAASGTLYHEAFHAVVDTLLTEQEYTDLFDAALKVYGNLGKLGLEEKLAEEFRKFVQNEGAAFIDYMDANDINMPIVKGIVRFFRRLWTRIKSLRDKTVYLNKLFYDINKGKFADRKIKENILDKVTIRQEEDAQLVLDRNPELASVGTAREYAAYINSIFPNSVEKDIYWHGSNEDFSDGFNTAKRGEGSGALETKKRNDLYLNRQGWASLQYVNGINRTGSDKNGFAHWNKLWWELKEIMSNGRRENNDWKDIVITDKDVNSIRQAIPNKRGKFDRDKGGTHGKWLKERKADYGYENKSDKEFFEEVFGLQLGKDTFNTWTARNAEVFKAMETTAKGIYPVVINVTNPIVEEGQNTYYEEQRGLFSQADRNGNDAILSRRADNEFNSDVAVVINANNKNVHWLGTKSDVEQFRQWKAKNVKQPKFDINERELEDIKKKAIADGTFMKAPNGNPTNLNERQWLQVRTKAFKDWFGDWERAYDITHNKGRSGLFRDMENKALANINPDFPAYNNAINNLALKLGRVPMQNEINPADLLKEAGLTKYIKTINFADDTVGEDVQFDLPEDYAEAQMDLVDLKKKHPNLNLKFHSYNVLNQQGEKFIKDFKKQDLSQSIYDDLNVINSVSKVVDENGEPLIVYHWADTDITTYNKDKAADGAFYFTDDPSGERIFSPVPNNMKYKSSVFLNIKNPLYGNDQNKLGTKEDFANEKNRWNRMRELANKQNKTKEENTELMRLANQRPFKGTVDLPVHLTETQHRFVENHNSDGIIRNWEAHENFYIVFNPNQIKSATDNVGTYSRENNDIRYRGAEMSVKQYHFQKLMYVNLSEEDKEYIKERGMSAKDYSSMNQAEKELFWKCR